MYHKTCQLCEIEFERSKESEKGNRVTISRSKGKAVPLQAWSGPESSRKLRFPNFMRTAQDGGKVLSLTHRPPLPQEIFLVLISVRGWVDPRAIVWPEGLCHWKIPMRPSGIEPVTCRFVAQYLNHYATAYPICQKQLVIFNPASSEFLLGNITCHSFIQYSV